MSACPLRPTTLTKQSPGLFCSHSSSLSMCSLCTAALQPVLGLRTGATKVLTVRWSRNEETIGVGNAKNLNPPSPLESFNGCGRRAVGPEGWSKRCPSDWYNIICLIQEHYYSTGFHYKTWHKRTIVWSKRSKGGVEGWSKTLVAGEGI